VPDGFEWQDVLTEPLAAVLPEDHALAGRESVDLSTLRELPFILFDPGFTLHRMILDTCRRRGFEPTVAAESSQIDFIVQLVAAGVGVAFLPRMIARQRRDSHVRHVLLAEPGTDWHLAMIWRRGAFLSHAARAWLALVKENADRHRPGGMQSNME